MPKNPRLETTASRLEPMILIVDDDPDTTDLLSELIERDGMRPLRASSVSEALYALEVRPVRFVITDYAMPGEDGLTLLRRLGEHPEWAQIPSLMVSGHDRHGDIARAARAHGAEFMAKPLDFTALLAAVRAAVEAELASARADEPADDDDASTMPARPAQRDPVIEIDATKNRDPRSE